MDNVMPRSKKSKAPTKAKEQCRYDPEFIDKLAERVVEKIRKNRKENNDRSS